MVIQALTFAAPLLVIVGVALILVGLAFVVYRQTLPPVSTLRRRLLAVLRAVSLVTILFLLFEPVLSWLDRSDERAKLLLLVDRSASMSLADQGTVRDSLVRQFLSRAEFKQLTESDQLRPFSFGDTAYSGSLDSVINMAPTMVGSDPAGAWQAALAARSSEDVGAIVVVTDGAHNAGPTPDRVAATSRILIFTVGVGDTSLRRDALIADLFTNDIAYQGSEVPVKVSPGIGIAGQTSRLRISDSQGRTLVDELVEFRGTLFEKTIDAKFLADNSGDFRITAALDSITEGITQDNNRRSRIIRVLNSKFQVVLLAGSPAADVTFLRQALSRDTTLEVTALVETRAGIVSGGRNSAEAIERAELFVFVNYPSSSSNAALWQSVAERIEQVGVPLLYQHGPNVSLTMLNRIADRLPVAFEPQPSPTRVPLRDARSHPALSSREQLPAPSADLPPTMGAVGKVTAKTSGVIVSNYVPEDNAWASRRSSGRIGGHESPPHRRADRIRTFRWELGLAKSANGADFYVDLIGRLSSWLLAPADEKRVKITTDRKVYSEGESVHFQGQVYGADLAPADDATVLVEISIADRRERISLVSRGNGLYDGDFTPWSSGDYSFAGFAVVRGDTLGKDNGSLVVEAFNLEWIDSRARFDLLQAVSANSGGKFVSVDRPDSLFANLNLQTKNVESAREIPLWNRPLILWFLIGFLAIEWLLRKRSGML
ncbi:MAG: hypothetical protein IPG71_13315 [bacterium]|nr:hypothetical protein [bacterium]